MSIATIKAVTRRIRLRIGSTEQAAQACGASPAEWSRYENQDMAEKTIPVGRLLALASASELAALAHLFSEAAETPRDVEDEAIDANVTTAKVVGLVHEAKKDGCITETEARPIRAAAVEAIGQMSNVLRAVS